MDAHPTLTTFVYIALVVVASLIILYWIYYTRRRMKTQRNVGTTEGIVMATERKEHNDQTGTIDPAA